MKGLGFKGLGFGAWGLRLWVLGFSISGLFQGSGQDSGVEEAKAAKELESGCAQTTYLKNLVNPNPKA